MSNKNIFTASPQITSLEIADLIGSRHDSVKRCVERLSIKGIINRPKIGSYENTKLLSPNRKIAIYIFEGDQGKRDSYVVVAQISPQHIGAVVDAWGRTANALQELLTALEAFDIPDDLPQDLFLYAIRECETGNIKLGISRDPRARLNQLQTGNSSRLELVAIRPAVNRFADERAVHADADAYRLRGEWFTAQALDILQ
jgi:hypothetical protein